MTKQLLIEKLKSDSQQQKLDKNYASIIERFHDDGFFPESMTGTYPGMFPRTVGALAQLLTTTGELELLEKCISCCMKAMEDFDLEYVPHVIGKDENSDYFIIDDLCQIDGQAHFILAWALLAEARDVTEFENQTYKFFSNLINRSISTIFLSKCSEWRCEPGVILNTHLEHSREWNMWNAYDFLSNSFIAAALEKMIDIAQRRQDNKNAVHWKTTLTFLLENINKNMIFDHEGKSCYCEMLLPTGREPEIFPGLSWLNLAPIPSGWQSFNHKIFSNTVDLWHQKACIEWEGPSITACELDLNFKPENVIWNGPEYMSCEWSSNGHNNQTYGKMLGWDLLYCVQNKDYKRSADILDFLEIVNTNELYSEIFTYKPSMKKWMLRDAGNGEQTAWLCWALFKSRKILGI